MEKTDFNEFPVFLQPRLRVFLSADLIGSTALKHRPFLPLAREEEAEASPKWLSSIADFYFNFASTFARSWTEITSPNAGEMPELWKANGDELIYTKEVENRQQVVCMIKAWVSAIRSYRRDLSKPGRLDLKSFGWVAGFPVLNSEIIFSSGNIDAAYEADSRLRNFYLIEQWYEKPTLRDNLIRDFIGPSLDAGFRLSQLATAQRMPISLDLAWLLATSQFPDSADHNFESLQLRYGARKVLKGVLGDQPVPHFWLDLMHDDKLIRAENKLLNAAPVSISASDIRSFCTEFYDRNPNHMFRPFIWKDKDYSFAELPENYVEKLKSWKDLWEREKGRYALENPQRPVGGGASGGVALPIQKVKEVLQLIETEVSNRAASDPDQPG